MNVESFRPLESQANMQEGKRRVKANPPPLEAACVWERSFSANSAFNDHEFGGTVI